MARLESQHYDDGDAEGDAYLLLHEQTLLLEEVLELCRTEVLLDQMLHMLETVRHHHRG